MKQYPFWWDSVPALRAATLHAEPTTEHAELRSRTFDVAIVGAGYTGLSAARALAKTGASVVVLEREHVGAGASSRNGGQVLTGLKLDPATLVDRYGERRARELFDISLASIARVEAIIAEEAIACDYARTGHIQAAWKPSHFEAFRAEQALLARVFGHHVDLVPPGSQQSELGSTRYHGLLVDERSGALNPAAYVHGLAVAACRAGAQIAAGLAADDVRRRGQGWTVTTAQGDIDAGDVLIATDTFTGEASRVLQRRVVPIGSYVIATEPLPEVLGRGLLPRGRMAFDSKDLLYYFRLTADLRLLFGGRAEFTQPTPETIGRAAEVLRRGMVAVFPELAATSVEYAWAGTVAFSRDQMPRAGRLDGMYYAGGYCGHGIAMATGLGELIARRMSGDRFEHPLLDDRFSTIPLYFGKPWFLPVVGAYYRVKDWIQ